MVSTLALAHTNAQSLPVMLYCTQRPIPLPGPPANGRAPQYTS